MIVRRDRTHHTGSSNLPIHERFCHLNSSLPESSVENHRASRSRLLHISHAKSQEVIKKRIDNLSVSPIDETKSYYEGHGKIPITKTLIGYPRTSCLEEKDKRKPVFVGDSPLYHKVRLLQSRSKSSGGIDKTTLDKLDQSQSVSNIRVTKRKQSLGSNKSEVKLLVAHQHQDETLRNNVQDQETSQASRKLKHKNQLTLLLKNRIIELGRNLRDNDEGNTGYLTPFLFEQAILKLRIHESAISANDIKELYDEYKITQAKLDYKNFINCLEDFKFPYDQSYNNQESTQLNTATLEQSCQKFNITDCRDLAYNMMSNYYKKSRKVGDTIKRFLPAKSDLNEYLVHTLKISQDEVEKRNFSKADFKGIVDGFLDKFKLDHLNQHEFEGFFSSVLFNRNGFTSFEEISKTIYEEKENDFLLKIQMKKKGPAPYEPKLFESCQVDSQNRLADQNSTSLKQLPFHSRRSSRSSLQTNEVPTREKAKQKNLESILKDIDSKVFMGRKSALKAFREFDMDGDGYISHRDIIQKVKASGIINNESVPDLIEHLDPEQKGALDFQSFSHKIRPNMVNDNEKGHPLERTISMICKPDFEKDIKMVEKTKHVMDNLRKKFDPATENQMKIIGKTKSSANPCWSNTFLNFQPNSVAPMFLSERERLNRRPSARTRYQIDDKMKVISTQDRKLEKIRRNQSVLKARIEENSNWLEQRDRSNLERRLLNQTTYENSTRKGNSIF